MILGYVLRKSCHLGIHIFMVLPSSRIQKYLLFKSLEKHTIFVCMPIASCQSVPRHPYKKLAPIVKILVTMAILLPPCPVLPYNKNKTAIGQPGWQLQIDKYYCLSRQTMGLGTITEWDSKIWASYGYPYITQTRPQNFQAQSPNLQNRLMNLHKQRGCCNRAKWQEER